MPPKKANTKAKATPAKAAAVAEPPATITTSRGKEIETTAAAGRPRRASIVSADTPAPKAKKTAPAKKAAPKATTTPAAGKKRGRPAKAAAEEVEAEPPKKRGRPAKAATEEVEAEPPKKKVGRPAKAAAAEEDVALEPPKKKVGRPAKAAPAVARKETAPPKKRGRPPKGGETTQVGVADDAAAEQLEGELVDSAEAEGDGEGPSKRTSPLKKRGRGRPPKANGKGKSAVTEAAAEEEDVDEGEEAETANGVDVKQYWLMKAEQEDREETLEDGSVFNAKFTIDDLRAKGGPEPWDGVRNPTACKNMKDMKLGDLAFFYASGGKKGRLPGITGIMEVVGESEPDLSAFDENAPYFAKNPKMRGTLEKPRWFMVQVEFRKKLSKPVTLKELQKYAEADGVLAEMQEFNTARLSVSKVAEKEWNFIVDELVEGYEDEALPAGETGGDTPMADADAKALDGVKQSIESDVPTTDTLLAADTAPTSSRPGSRGGSRSRANGLKPGSRPGSRAASLQPPVRAGSRGRSGTPAGRARSTQAMTTLTEEM